MSLKQATLEVELTPKPTEPAALTVHDRPADTFLAILDRLTSNPAASVDVIERLIAAQERVEDRRAEAAFNIAFAEMQADIPEITERGEIKGRDGAVQSKYARNEDIQKVLRPILKRFGFSLSFRTEWPDAKHVKVVGILTHRDGHARTSEFFSEADTSGNKNAIQALGSSVSYGRRYTTLDLLNITSRGQDDDGEGFSKKDRPDAPHGYDNWTTDLAACADEGFPKLSKAFNTSKEDYRKYLTKYDPAKWETLKDRARKVAV